MAETPVNWEEKAMEAYARIEDLECALADYQKRVTQLESIMQDAIDTLQDPLLDPPEREDDRP